MPGTAISASVATARALNLCSAANTAPLRGRESESDIALREPESASEGAGSIPAERVLVGVLRQQARKS
jgi:hypothetical protein